jgi:PhoH-like ATPase
MKDLIMAAHALDLIEKGEFQKIIFIRPNVTVANVPEIGYLKGTVEEKLGWTLGPLYDKVGGEEGIERLVERGQLEMVPLLFIRGRSFENSIIYVTECQNSTREIIKLLLSRVGEGSELWINADNKQTDNKIYEKDNGVYALMNALKGNPLFGYIYLSKTERSEVANLCNLLD